MKLEEILKKSLRIADEDLSDDLNMMGSTFWDSLTHMRLIIDLETELKITFSGEEISEMTSIGAIRSIVNDKAV